MYSGDKSGLPVVADATRRATLHKLASSYVNLISSSLTLLSYNNSIAVATAVANVSQNPADSDFTSPLFKSTVIFFPNAK